MLTSNLLTTVEEARSWLGRFPSSLIELLFRIGIGSVFFKSGLTKIANWTITVGLFRDEYRVPVIPPEFAAYMATAAELTFPVLLVLGIGARFGALGLLGMTLVIQTFVYPENWSEHLLWASLLIYVLTRGAGPLSLDHLIARSVLRKA